MRKLLYGAIIGFFAGLYSLFALLISNERIRMALKDALVVEMDRTLRGILYGKDALTRPRYYPYARMRYQSPAIYRSGRAATRATHRTGKRRSSSSEEWIFGTKEDGQKALDSMLKLIESYGYVTMADLMDLVGCSKSKDDDKRGWADLTGSWVAKDKLGYILHLPNPENIPVS